MRCEVESGDMMSSVGGVRCNIRSGQLGESFFLLQRNSVLATIAHETGRRRPCVLNEASSTWT